MTDRIEATYLLRCPADEIAARAEALAVEQSIEMPPTAVREARILREMVGEVRGVTPEGDDCFRVVIGLAAESAGSDAGQLLNVLIGNSSLHPEVMLAGFTLPPGLALGSGPRLGLDGLRRRTGAGRRALTCSALKPQGLDAEALAALAAEFARGGIDYVKDDHALADQRYSPLAQRLPACAEAVAGTATRYVPSLTGTLDGVRRGIALMRAHGLDTAMLAPAVLGYANAQAIARENPDIALFAHPSLAGAARIAPPCHAQLLRLIGMDGIIFPNHGGRFGYTPETCQAIAAACHSPAPAAVPIPAGGMSVARVPEMLGFYGPDVMLLIGGNLLEAGDGLAEATARFVQAVCGYEETTI